MGANGHQAILGQATQDADRMLPMPSCHNPAPDVAINRGTLAIETRCPHKLIHLSPIDHGDAGVGIRKSGEPGKEPVQFNSGVRTILPGLVFRQDNFLCVTGAQASTIAQPGHVVPYRQATQVAGGTQQNTLVAHAFLLVGDFVLNQIHVDPDLLATDGAKLCLEVHGQSHQAKNDEELHFHAGGRILIFFRAIGKFPLAEWRR